MAATAAASAPAMTAPDAAAARMSAPVLRACMASSAGTSRIGASRPGPGRTAPRSIAWPPTMPAGPAACATQRHDAQLARDDRGIGRLRLARDETERFGLQAVAGEDRHAVALDDVQRRSSAPQRVVVHGRQVVVDERIGVDHLDRARRRQASAIALDRMRSPRRRPPHRRRRASRADEGACRRPSGCSAWRPRTTAGVDGGDGR